MDASGVVANGYSLAILVELNLHSDFGDTYRLKLLMVVEEALERVSTNSAIAYHGL